VVKFLSEDLRVGVIGALDRGASRHAAPARFRVSIATAVRWLRSWRDDGVSAAKLRDGDRHSLRIGAFGAVILVVRSLLSIPDSSVNRPTKYRAVRRQRLWDQTGDLRCGGVLAHRNSKESVDEPEILCGPVTVLYRSFVHMLRREGNEP
jgi:hypothetical protein